MPVQVVTVSRVQTPGGGGSSEDGLLSPALSSRGGEGEDPEAFAGFMTAKYTLRTLGLRLFGASILYACPPPPHMQTSRSGHILTIALLLWLAIGHAGAAERRAWVTLTNCEYVTAVDNDGD